MKVLFITVQRNDFTELCHKSKTCSISRLISCFINWEQSKGMTKLWIKPRCTEFLIYLREKNMTAFFFFFFFQGRSCCCRLYFQYLQGRCWYRFLIWVWGLFFLASNAVALNLYWSDLYWFKSLMNVPKNLLNPIFITSTITTLYC